MSSPAAVRLVRLNAQNLKRALPSSAIARPSQLHILRRIAAPRESLQTRWLSSTLGARAGLMPHTGDPQPPKQEETANGSRATQPTELSDEEYHLISEELMEAINDKAEALQESQENVEVEYSAGVLSITHPTNGTYVINKQPPNKQIWLSSPISGPKRFDWVLLGESMHQKEGSGNGDWIYLRDGTSLTELLQQELGLLVDVHEVDTTGASKDPTE